MLTIHLTIELHQGIIADVQAYRNEHPAQIVEERWLTDNDIKNHRDREAKAQDGTEFYIFKCFLKD